MLRIIIFICSCEKHTHKHGVAAEAKLEIAQKTTALATLLEDDEHHPFTDLDENEKLENLIIIENDAEAKGTTT